MSFILNYFCLFEFRLLASSHGLFVLISCCSLYTVRFDVASVCVCLRASELLSLHLVTEVAAAVRLFSGVVVAAVFPFITLPVISYSVCSFSVVLSVISC